ncbi:hypothetical protein [Sphingomonas jeddahensis]|uniref:hypothetical protein n=1 Tax=Sphingomonas jeddahensis TaxID=1915074 RepID=UPI001E340E40|nr:hypothetical protein [Sphingomonas jeddahensis]
MARTSQIEIVDTGKSATGAATAARLESVGAPGSKMSQMMMCVSSSSLIVR